MKGGLYFRIKEFVTENDLIKEGDAIAVALSGGADSTFLLSALSMLKKEWGLKLFAVHVNHGIRGAAADEDERFAVEFASKLGCECRVFRGDVPAIAKEKKMTQEEAGRSFRYECLEKARAEFGCVSIAVAHHLDDQAETVLFHLIRGSGLRGLGGMRPRTGKIIRPLLCVSRREIEEALDEDGIKYCLDATNEDCKYARNAIRNKVMPDIVKNLQPEASAHIALTAKRLREAYDYISAAAREKFVKAVEIKDGICAVSASNIMREDPVIRREIFLYMLEYAEGGRKDVTARHVEMLMELASCGGSKKINLPRGVCAIKEYDRIYVGKANAFPSARETPDAPAARAVKCPGTVFLERADGGTMEVLFCLKSLGEAAGAAKNSYAKRFDYDKIKSAPQFRRPREGDYMTLRPDGGKKKLSRLFIDDKVPAAARKKMWVLAEADHVLWVPELGRCSAHYYVDEGTKNVLTAEIIN